MTDRQPGSEDTPAQPVDATTGAGREASARAAEVARVTSDNQAAVEMRRASMGLYAVVASDVAIALAAIIGVLVIHSDSADATSIVSILSSAFTAVGTLTTAYFGIKATANTAKNSMVTPPDPSGGGSQR